MRATHNFFHCQLLTEKHGYAVIQTEVGEGYKAEELDIYLAFELLSHFQLVSMEAHSEYSLLRENYFFENVEMFPVVQYTGKWAAPFTKAEYVSQLLRDNPAYEVDILDLCQAEDGEILDFPFSDSMSLNLMKLKYEAIYAKISAELKVDTLLMVECAKHADGRIDMDAPACLAIHSANYLPEEKQVLYDFAKNIIREFAFEKRAANGNVPEHWVCTLSYNPC